MPRATKRNAVLLAASVMAWGSGASCVASCPGHPRRHVICSLCQERVVVDLDIRDRSPRNLALADRFLKESVRQEVAVGQDANVLLHIQHVPTGRNVVRNSSRCRTDLFRVGRSRGRWDAAEAAARAYDGHEGIAVCTCGAAAAGPEELGLAGKNTRIIWVASLQCQMTGLGKMMAEVARVGPGHWRRTGYEGGAAGEF